MYLRTIHAEFDIPALRRFIRQNPLGILITALPSANFPTLQCTHIPWLLDVVDEDSQTELGTLRGHLAKQNPHSKAMTEAVQRGSPSASNGLLEYEVSVVFTGPVHSYVTPKFYVETKPSTGKVVPTWNYSAVQAYGRATVLFDSHNVATDVFLSKQITDLTRHSEMTLMNYTGIGDRAPPWEVSDAPNGFIKNLKKSIIGIEIAVDRLEGKYKMTQEMGMGDRNGVIDGFQALQTDDGLLMAKVVEERGAIKDTEKQMANKT